MITTPTSIDIMCYVSDIIVYLYPLATTILVVQLTHCRATHLSNDTSSAGLNWYFSYVFLTSSYLHTGCS